MSNATEHRHNHGVGLYLVSTITRRCSSYFGTYNTCKRIITPGATFFDTQEQTNSNKPGSHYIVCEACAKASPLPRAIRRFA